MAYSPSLSSRAIIGKFYRKLEAEFAKSWASRLGAMFPSDQESETYEWTGQVPQMREWGTGRLSKELRTYGQTIRNVVYETSMSLPLDLMRRDKTGQVNVRINELGRRPVSHWEKLLSALMLGGEGQLCYDGQYFFDVDHVEGDSGVQKNLLTAGEVAALNIATATAPTQAEAAQAVLGVIGYMASWLDDQGEPINGEARSFIAVCGTPDIWSAMLAAATKPVVLGAGNTQVPNPLAATGFQLDVIYNPRLAANTTKFDVYRADGDVAPFVLQEEQAPKVDAIAEGSEMEIKERKHHYGVTAIRGVGYGMWQSAARGTFS